MSKKRFVVISRTPSVVDQNSVTAFLQGRSWGYWHWMDDCWLISTESNLSLKELSNAIRSVAPALRFIVFEVKNDKKAGWGPKAWWEWFANNWNESAED